MTASKSNKGFTLLEIIIAMMVSSLLMAAIYSILKTQRGVSTVQEQTAAVQQNLRSALYIMQKEIRMAGYAGTSTAGSTAVGFDAATATSMQFRYLTDSRATVNTQATIVYALADSDGDGDTDDLERTVDGTASVIAENIEAIEFYYTYTDTAGATQQSTAPPTTAEVNTITSVEVSILARSSKFIPDNKTGKQYTTPSGAVWGNTVVVGADTVFEDYDDGFYRRYATSNIICRNL